MIKRVLLVIVVVIVLTMAYTFTHWSQVTSFVSETDQETTYTEEADDAEAENLETESTEE